MAMPCGFRRVAAAPDTAGLQGSAQNAPSVCFPYGYVMLAKPGGVELVFQALKVNAEELSDMGKVVEIVTAQGVQIAA